MFGNIIDDGVDSMMANKKVKKLFLEFQVQ